MSVWTLFTTIFYAITMASMLFLIGTVLYQLFLVRAYRQRRGPDREPVRCFVDADLPSVTIQLPVYNEGHLAGRIIRLAAALDYPPNKLQIQYLDDSDDTITSEVARSTIAQLRREKPEIDFQYLSRDNREGFKAGALKLGTEHATGAFLAIFDADFQIPGDYLRKTIHHFTDPEVGAVQARWDYTNANQSLFTRLQANKLDAHQMFEQTGRARMGFVTIFHGTAGIWRREALDAAGGWTCLSEVEDVEITIRAAARGWRLVYLDHFRVRSELPVTVNGFLRQQMRWRRGWTRVVLHYSGMVWRADLPLRTRLDLLMRINTIWGSVAALVTTLGVLPAFLVAERLGLVVPTTILYSSTLVLGLVLRHFEGKTLEEDPAARPALCVHPLLGVLPLGYVLFSLGMLWPMAQATLEGFRKGQTWEVTPKSGTTQGSIGHAANDRSRLPGYVYGTLALCFASAALAAFSAAGLTVLPTVFYTLTAFGCGAIGVMLLQFFGYRSRFGVPLVRVLTT